MPHLMRIAFFVLVLMTSSCTRDRSGIQIDSSEKGTEVFYDAIKLGKTPLRLTSKRLAELGLPDPSLKTNSVVTTDGWGSGVLLVDRETRQEHRLMMLVRPSKRSRYIAIESPWGPPTVSGAYSFADPLAPKILHMKTPDAAGMTLSVEVPDAVVLDEGTNWTLTVTLRNTSATVIQGFRPSLMVMVGRYVNPVEPRHPQHYPLPADWATIEPGAERQYTCSFPTPRQAGDYSVLAIFHLFADETTSLLAYEGAVYSGTRLLRVQQVGP